MIPSGYKEDVVYSEIPINGAGDLTFTRASNGTRIDSDGNVEVVPWNIVTYSEDFTNAVWNTYSGSSITANDATAPNGTTTADRLNSSTNIFSGIYQSMGTLPTNVYTYSIYVKAGTNTYFYMLGQGSSSQYAFFNLNTGVVGNTANIDSASIESVGNGWYRCQIQKTGNAVEMFIGSSNIQNFTPTASGTVYLWGAQVNIGSTAKPYFPTTDRLNVPRLTYQNGGGGCPSLLLEKQSTNLFSYSEQFNNAAWNKDTGIVITPNAAISPDGTQNASLMDYQNNSISMYRYPGTGGVQYTMSVYVKAYSGYNGKKIGLVNGPSSLSVTLTNEWQRVDLTATISSPNIEIYNRVDFEPIKFYLWGAQYEASSYPTSYIPTTSSSATRVADLAYKSSISSLFGASATSFFMDFEITQASSGGNWTVTGYDGSNLFSLCQFDTANNYPRIVFDGGVDTTLGTALSIGRHKIAVSFATNDFRAYIDGALVLTDTSCTYNRYNRIAVNGTAWTGNTNNTNSFKLNQYAQFPNTLTNAELASLTTI